MNKKMRHQEGGTKKRTRRTAKIQKAIAGLSLEDIKKKHALKKAVPVSLLLFLIQNLNFFLLLF